MEVFYFRVSRFFEVVEQRTEVPDVDPLAPRKHVLTRGSSEERRSFSDFDRFKTLRRLNCDIMSNLSSYISDNYVFRWNVRNENIQSMLSLKTNNYLSAPETTYYISVFFTILKCTKVKMSQFIKNSEPDARRLDSKTKKNLKEIPTHGI